MLYNTKWQYQPKRRWRLFGWLRPLKPKDVFTLVDFTVWVSQQPADREYDYIDPLRCAMGQYLQLRGVSELDSMLNS